MTQKLTILDRVITYVPTIQEKDREHKHLVPETVLDRVDRFYNYETTLHNSDQYFLQSFSKPATKTSVLQSKYHQLEIELSE